MSVGKLISRIVGEASQQSNIGLVKATKSLAEILNQFKEYDVEDTSPRPGTQGEDDCSDADPDWDNNPEYDTSGESEDLAFFRSAIFQWVESAKGLVGQDKDALRAIDTIDRSVRHYMRHESRDCMYNIAQPWTEFLEDSNANIRLDFNTTKDEYEARFL